MTALWQTIFVRAAQADAVANALTTAFAAQGYRAFDPFPGGAGTPVGIKDTIRLFVAPPVAALVRVIGTLPEMPALPLDYLYLAITAASATVTAYRQGEPDAAALQDYLKADVTAEQFANAQQRPALGIVAQEAPASNLPPELAQFAQAQGVSTQQADKLFNKLTGQLFSKMDRQSGGEAGALKDQANALLRQSTAKIDWNSGAARKLLALTALLALPPNWREPEFDALREAYQVARRLARNPNAMLLPDEKASLQQVSNAIEYRMVYGGK